MASFDKMLADNIQNRLQESTKVPTLDIAVPMHIKSQKAKCKYHIVKQLKWVLF